MIAANYRKHPEAMALQLVLQFGRLLVWALPRPTTRVLRSIRAARGAAFKDAGRICYPEKKSVPSWVRAATKRARDLAKAVKTACIRLDFQAPAVQPEPSANPYRKMVLAMRERFKS